MLVDGVRLSLWRAAALYRVVTLLACLYLIVRWRDLYERESVAFATGAGMVLVTVIVCVLAGTGRAHRRSLVVVDLVATFALTLLTIWAQTSAQRHGGMPTLTTIWAAGPVLEAGFVGGWLAGLLGGAVQGGAAVVVRAGYDGRTVSSVAILLIAGAVVGYVATLVVRSEAELAAAVSARSMLAERERLARTVHDGVLQVLGLVHRTGRETSGEWGRLAKAAGDQEARLRALITSRVDTPTSNEAEVVEALRALRSDRVTVSTPANAPSLTPQAGTEVVAAVRAVLHNVEQHAGPDAHAWVLVEDLDHALRVTIRDDGVGFADGRLNEAQGEGRLGVASSICGRIQQLGGEVTVTSGVGEGTVIEMVVPIR